MARPKLDVVYFKNGDRWTCEVQKLERGILTVGLDYVDGSVSVNWSEVERIESPQLFRVGDSKGQIFTGPLHTLPGREKEEPIIEIGQAEDTAKSQIRAIEQTDARFWKTIHGGVDGGLNFTKSNEQTQFNFSTYANYIKSKWSAQSQFQSTFNGSRSAISNLRNDFRNNATRMLSKSYFAIAVAELLKSDEQQLALRTTFGGGLGRLLKNTENARLGVFAGAAWTRERYTQQSPDTQSFNSAEGLLGANFRYFRFKSFNYNLTLSIYPSMNIPGRVRYAGNTSLKYEVIKNLYLNISVYANYDSQPPRQTIKTDFGASSTLGWSF